MTSINSVIGQRRSRSAWIASAAGAGGSASSGVIEIRFLPRHKMRALGLDGMVRLSRVSASVSFDFKAVVKARASASRPSSR
jgi:hypothetical protein